MGKVLWEDYRSNIVAFGIYEGFILFIVPMIHKKAVLGKNGHLVHPAAQSAMILVWEMFYLPQSALSIILKALYCFGVSIVMFLRPDEAVLPPGRHWLDGMHNCYVGAVYEHLQTGKRKHDRST